MLPFDFDDENQALPRAVGLNLFKETGHRSANIVFCDCQPTLVDDSANSRRELLTASITHPLPAFF